MASLREAVFQFRGDANPLIQELTKLNKKIRDLPDHTELDIGASAKELFAEAEAVEARMKELGALHPEIKPHLNLRGLLADVGKAKAALRTLPNEETILIKIQEIDLKKSRNEARIDKLKAKLSELEQQRPEIVIEARIEKTMVKIDNLEEKLKKLRTRPQTFTVKAQIATAEADIKLLNAQLDELGTKNPRIQIDAEIGSTIAEIAGLEATIEALEKKKHEIRIKADTTATTKIQQAGRAIEDVTSGLEQGARAAERAALPSFNLGRAFGSMSSVLRRLGPLVTGFGIVLIATLLPAILAVTAALGAAVLALGALATAFAASLGPVAALLVPVFLRLSKVIQAFQARTTALKNSMKDQRAEAQKSEQAESQLASARNAVRDANEQLVTAERNLKEARQAAREAIGNAREQNAAAAREELAATEELKRAEVAAYESIRQAIEDVKDARNELANAKLGEQQAKLDTKQAQLNLKKLREQMNLAGKQFDSTFQKFEDASFNLGDLKGALKGAGANPAGDPAEAFLKLQQGILDVSKAQQGEKDAADRTSDAHQDLNKKIKESNRLQRTGIKGVDGYRTAQEHLRDAVRTHADTQKRLNKLEKDGVENSPQVIAAQEALRDADQQRNTALRNQHDLIRQQAEDVKDGSTSWQAYQDALKELDPTEKKLLALFVGVKDLFGSMKGATDAVFNGIVDGVLKVLPHLSGLGDRFKELGQIWGNQIRTFATQITLPPNLFKFGQIFEGTKSLAKTLGDTFRNTFQILINLAVAAMPFLVQIGQQLANWTQGLANSSADTGKLQQALKPMFTAFMEFVGILKEVGGVIINTFNGASGPINRFLGWVRKGLKGFNTFLKSTEGKNKVKQFFKDTLPFVKSAIKFIIAVGKVLLTAFQIALPILKPVLDMVTGMVDIFGFLLGILNKILGPFKGLIGIAISFFVPFGKLGGIIEKITGFFKKFGGVFGGVRNAIKNFGAKLKGDLTRPFINAWHSARELFETIGGTFGRIALRVMDRIEKILKGVWKVVTWPFRKAWDGVKAIFEKIKKPLGDAATAIWNGIKAAFKGVKGFFSRVFGTIGEVFKTTLNGVIKLINKALRLINKVTPGPIKVLGKQITPGIPDIPEIPLLASGGVTRGATRAVIGEGRFQEAVIPLSKQVLGEIGRAIASAMGSPLQGRRVAAAGSGRVPGGGGPKQVFEKVEVHMSSPGGRMQDPRAAAVAFARELNRRG